jgi:hypothetical protein
MAVQWCLSGVPRKLEAQIKREAFLIEELTIKRELERAGIRANFADQSFNANDDLRKRKTRMDYPDNNDF